MKLSRSLMKRWGLKNQNDIRNKVSKGIPAIFVCGKDKKTLTQIQNRRPK